MTMIVTKHLKTSDEPMDQFEEFVKNGYNASTPHIIDRKLFQKVVTDFPDPQEIPISKLISEPHPADNIDHQKIHFAAVLNLMPTNVTHISCEPLSRIELSYIEKCKAMVDMHRTFICACHNIPHRSLSGLLSHLRALRIWFPLFTCYNCMITFTNRSTLTRHTGRCPCQSLDSITKLSNLRKRSGVKTRLYQNFKCTTCKIVFSFHEDFRRHVDDKHLPVKSPFSCQCCEIFNNIEEYEDHVYTSCLVNYHCDVCSTTTKTLDDFQRHARNFHDNSEGFILLQDDNHSMRKQRTREKKVENGTIPTEKEEDRSSVRAFIIDTAAYKNTVTVKNPSLSFKSRSKKCPICSKEYSTSGNMMRHYKVHNMRKPLLGKEDVNRKGEGMASVRTDNVAYKNTVRIIDPVLTCSQSRKCSICSKEIFNYNNMMQHCKHLEKLEVTKSEEEEALYPRQECGGMYNSAEWLNHLADKHESHVCGECGESFQFKTELEQHGIIHWNLKLFRDSKTQSYKSIAISPRYDDKSKMKCEVYVIREELVDLQQTHEDSSSVASAESCTSTDENISKYLLRNKEFVTFSDLSDNKKTGNQKRKTPLPSSFSVPENNCDNQCQIGSANRRHNMSEEENTNIRKKTMSSAKVQSEQICKICFKGLFSKPDLKNHMKFHELHISLQKKIIRTPSSTICQRVSNTIEEVDEYKEKNPSWQRQVDTSQ